LQKECLPRHCSIVAGGSALLKPDIWRTDEAKKPTLDREESSMSHSLRVLVVDDNRDAAEGLKRVVRLMGHEVQAVFDERAILLVQEYEPDVILLDVGMPRMDGFTMAGKLRELMLRRQPVIIAVTGFHDEVTERRCYESGFNHFLVKPVDTVALRMLLTDCRPG
jgi:CheY-like chemotaxis protein